MAEIEKKEIENSVVETVEQEINEGYFDVDLNEIVPKPGWHIKLKESNFYTRLAKKSWLVMLPFFVVTGFLIILPLASIVLFSIIKPEGGSLVFKTSFEKYIYLFTNSSIWYALFLGLGYAFIASVFSIVVAYPIAFIMSNLRNKFLVKNLWVLVTMPMWINSILKLIGLQSLFYMLAPSALGTQFAIIVGMIYLFLPFAISPIYTALENRDISIEKASFDLGASKSRTFWNHTFRFSMPGVMAAFSLVLIQSTTSLIVVKYMGAGKVNLVTSIIESYFFMGTDYGYGAALSVVLAIFVLIILVLTRLISNKFETVKKGNKKWKSL